MLRDFCVIQILLLDLV